MQINRKAAPRQEIVRIDRIGPWGRVEYVHVLACGHKDIRKRASKAPAISCAGCALAEQHVAEISSLKTQGVVSPPANDAWVDYDAEEIDIEMRSARARARVAGLLGISADDIEVRVDVDFDRQLKIQGFVIHLDEEQAKRLSDT